MIELTLKNRLLRELTWYLPSLACVALVIRIAALNPSANVLNIIGWSAALVVGLFTIFMARLAPGGSHEDVGLKPIVASLGIMLLLVTQTIYWPLPWKMDRPSVYFSGDLKVGMAGDIPDFNDFETELMNWISNHYGHNKWQAFRLFNDEREKDLENGKVDLVVSTYTATVDRALHVDFAGPYYLDTAGVWGNLAKFQDGRWVNPHPGQVRNPTICGVSGTTGNNSLASFLRTPDGTASGAKEATKKYANTADCLKDLFDPSSEVAYAATDWSILKAQKSNAEIFDAARTHPNINPQTGEVLAGDPGPAGWGTEDKPQYYAVAIRNGNPATCKDLTGVIREFVEQNQSVNDGFSGAYNRHLKPKLGPVKNDWHKPNLDALDWGAYGSPICK